MKTVYIESELAADLERVWRDMQLPATFLYLCRGLFGVPALAGRTEPLHAGERGTGWLMAFHVLPAYRHTIEVLSVDEATHTIRTHEYGGRIRSWNHTLHAESIGPGRCRYADTIDIDAGWFTGVVALGAAGIFRYRHRRWHKLIRSEVANQTPKIRAAFPPR
ncbi:hypothetical protein [Mycolicibacterium llatzerense]|uniref:Polyketide cyclase n=1 Tax=Mycolicibacterium llatzerense TaxID=280871 RepID=A0A0D1LQ07_9MYCO|nr:hypothetical protein [Mycolicibacterium llatzerense]KIU18156.1 hypothetical protein TL10_03640 [Mycolicibacterium llatzerense]